MSRRIILDKDGHESVFLLAVAQCIGATPSAVGDNDLLFTDVHVVPFEREAPGIIYHDRTLRFQFDSQIKMWRLTQE